ncbi:hypothetical protein FGB62_169g40 [Gracilaria domingensis]|nr:hypothetical protein FGB62_169g40 [Gracilaria domingensis]
MATNFANAKIVVLISNESSDGIDFTKHVSADGSRVSGSYILAHTVWSCTRINETNVINYPAVGSFEDIDRIAYNLKDPFNITCAFEKNGFVSTSVTDPQTFYMYEDNEKESNVSDTDEITEPCPYRLDEFPTNYGIKQVNVSYEAGNCEGTDILEAWCGNLALQLCVWYLRKGERYFMQAYVAEGPDLAWFDELPLSKALTRQTLQSVIFLLSTGVERSLFHALGMTRVRIKRNMSVEVLAGEVQETVVLVSLMVCTAGVVTVVTGLMSLVSFWQWRHNVVKRGLKGKNAFQSATDLIQVAATVAQGEEDFASSAALSVGVYGDKPRVGPVAETNIGDPEIQEEMVEGRWRRRGELKVSIFSHQGAESIEERLPPPTTCGEVSQQE